MDFPLTNFQIAIQKVFNDYINFLGETEDIHLEAVIDKDHDRYLLIELGWENGRRIYGTLIHIDIINNKLWIQQDGTEAGIADDLIAFGIPKHQIVLGFKPIERRELTEFAVF
ncbi:XisI protein [Synechococcus sp. PCC 7502]|uniref:XisI protein n=1 Tax=Synechococcus sp. PCC 7502 TaxID=1173263 RepID=UPI00029F9132|nr:XisI protein [Synechococcus sp. PCC 7502]AFY74064.1 XisI protein [Synechococcus sp. PCC 7502]